jgi:prepilin-type N-terminal cleavage/methylation domain-containing protein
MKRIRRGFTLIEVIVVIVILGIASAAVVKMVVQVASGGTDNQTLQVGSQLLQECGEWILANHRRDENYYTNVLTAGTSTNCFSGPSAYGSFSAPTVVVTDVSGTSSCPTGGVCKQVAISISSGGSSLNTVNLIVMKYGS